MDQNYGNYFVIFHYRNNMNSLTQLGLIWTLFLWELKTLTNPFEVEINQVSIWKQNREACL